MQKMFVIKLISWVVPIVSCLTLTGCNNKSAAGGPPPMGKPEVAVVTVKPESITLTSELPGRTSAFRTSEIRPQVSGIILKRLFTEGSEVKAGQILYEIDQTPFKANMDNAKATVSVAQEVYNQALAALEASMAGVSRQKATLELALANRNRFEEALKDRAVSSRERDQAAAEAEIAKASLSAAEAQAESDRKAVAKVEANIKQAEAAMKTASISLGYTKITAPISGHIGKSNLTDGALISAYQPIALTTIQQLDPIYVDVTQSTSERQRLKRAFASGTMNQDEFSRKKIKLILEDGTLYPLEGTLQFRDVTVDPSTGSFILRATFPNPDRELLPGMFVRAIVTDGVQQKAIMIPQQAISFDPKGNPFVLVVDDHDKVSQRTVTLDRAIGDKWLVSTGLTSGERVIVEGRLKARPGSEVKVVPFNEPAKDIPAAGSDTKMQKQPGGGA